MYIIISYDIKVEKGINKHWYFDKICSQYLFHLHNSLFYGEITMTNYNSMLKQLKSFINFTTDKIAIFKIKNKNNIDLSTISGDVVPDLHFY